MLLDLEKKRTVGWKSTFKKTCENAALKFSLLSEKFKWIMWSHLFCDLRLCRRSQKLHSPLTASHYKCVDVVQPEFLLKCVCVFFFVECIED